MHKNLFALLILISSIVFPATAKAASGALEVDDLRCEYLKDPLAVADPAPRLSWIVISKNKRDRGLEQAAYQILAASSPSALSRDDADLWDSGKVGSSQSTQVRYAGRQPAPGHSCYWKVRVWERSGRPSAWSDPAQWTAAPAESSWRANWIGLDEKESLNANTNVLGAARWIWFPGGNPERSAPVGMCYFRREVQTPANREIKRATLRFTSDNTGEFYINSVRVGAAGDFHSASEVDVTSCLSKGRNILAASVNNLGEGENPAGLIACLKIELTAGNPMEIFTDAAWHVSKSEAPGWKESAFKPTPDWAKAQELGPAGIQPWGPIVGPEDRRLPARMLRHEFTLERKVERAIAYVSGLGLSELYANGHRIGDHVLSPALTDYTKRVSYVAFDLTDNLRRGQNAIGVILGNGRFYAPRSKVPTGTASYGFPKLYFQMDVTYSDGTSAQVVSDSSWTITTNGPVGPNNEYDGEEYDARREMPGWNQPGFDASTWQPAQSVTAPGGLLVPQAIEPIRVTGTIHPISLTEPRPGVFIFDMGQNMVGWCKLRVRAPSGTMVSLRHAETLKPDGTLYLDNIRGAKVTDTYTAKGKGLETYEPRFTYHGFRYVEVTGFPGKPTLSSIEGRVVNDDLRSAGAFSCSIPILNRIYTNVLWGVRGNYRSIPTDCPQRDERQGWLGDRSAEAKGETYLFDTAALYSKWLQDMKDAQKESGSVPDVCPAYWPIYSDNVTWPSSTVIIPSTLRDQYADVKIIERHYESARKWMNFMSTFITNGIISRDSYGDWCVPPESQQLIHSNDPKRKTDKALIATAYFYYDLLLMADYARQLGNQDDVRHFTDLGRTMKSAFNRQFLNTSTGQYDNGSQTSCVLPLAFGLVPQEHRAAVFQRLVDKITGETDNHIGTGLIGGQWLMRVLSDNGRPDLALKLATQTTYPSWGYMIEKGATTIWELWNGDTADPAMNSGNHVMLVGDLVTWMHEYLAGIAPDPQDPGFRHIVMRPQVTPGLDFVKASHQSPQGRISSHWQKSQGKFTWKISIPVNSRATVHVPTDSAESVQESGIPISRATGVRFVKFTARTAVYELGSGSYEIQSCLTK